LLIIYKFSKEGDKTIYNTEEKEKITEDNYKLIHYVCNNFNNGKISYAELVSNAQFGFVKALNAFDIDKGIKFSTFAIACMNNEMFALFRKEKKELEHYNLDNIIFQNEDGKDTTLKDVIADVTKNVEEEIINKDEHRLLYKAIDNLKKNERIAVIEYYFKEKNQAEIAKILDITQASVHNLLKKAYQILKKELVA